MLDEKVRKQKFREEREELSGKNMKALVLMARCYCKQKNFEDALRVIEEVVESSRKKKMAKVEYAFALVEKANILAEVDTLEKYQKAIEIQESAISTHEDKCRHSGGRELFEAGGGGRNVLNSGRLLLENM